MPTSQGDLSVLSTLLSNAFFHRVFAAPASMWARAHILFFKVSVFTKAKVLQICEVARILMIYLHVHWQ
jgi:hypothetical protein